MLNITTQHESTQSCLVFWFGIHKNVTFNTRDLRKIIFYLLKIMHILITQMLYFVESTAVILKSGLFFSYFRKMYTNHSKIKLRKKVWLTAFLHETSDELSGWLQLKVCIKFKLKESMKNEKQKKDMNLRHRLKWNMYDMSGLKESNLTIIDFM